MPGPTGRPALALASTLTVGAPTFLDAHAEAKHRGHPADSPSRTSLAEVSSGHNAILDESVAIDLCRTVAELGSMLLYVAEPAGTLHTREAGFVTIDRPWKAAPDVFVVTQPTEDFLRAMVEATRDLSLESADAECRFYTQARQVDAPSGPAVVVTDIAEYASSGAKKSAVVVSGLVQSTGAGQRTLTVRTHLEDQATRFEGDVIVFEAHHDAIRAALVAAVLEVEPQVDHQRQPRPPVLTDNNATAAPHRRQAVLGGPVDGSGPDLRSLAGMGLLGLGVIVLLIAVASGSWKLIVVGLVFTAMVGWAGNRIAGA